MKGHDKGGQGPTSGCCAIEEEESGLLTSLKMNRRSSVVWGQRGIELVLGKLSCQNSVVAGSGTVITTVICSVPLDLWAC
jgi:hypothetical protein